MNTIDNTPYISNPFKVIFKGFAQLIMYNQNLSIIILIASYVLYGWSYLYPEQSNVSTSPPITESQGAILLIIIAITVLVIVPLYCFITVMLSGITAYTILKTNRQETTTFKEAWKATLSKFWTLLYLDIIIFFKVLGGLLLFIIPGIRAALRYNLAHILVFDKNLSAKESAKMSKELSKGHLIEIFGIMFASGLIPIVGSLMTMGGISVAYSQLTRLHTDSSYQKTDVHWLNYLGIILIGLLLLIMVLMILAIAITRL